MREILFRGKRVDNGEWVHGGYMAYDFDSPFGEMVPRSNIVSYEEGDGNGFWFEVAPETVGQYTGLTDKNGKKIFEGDIVRHYNFSIFPEYFSLGVIFYDECACMFGRTVVKQVGGEEYTKNANDIAKISKKCVYEVIGNIHDNPELLTEATP